MLFLIALALLSVVHGQPCATVECIVFPAATSCSDTGVANQTASQCLDGNLCFQCLNGTSRVGSCNQCNESTVPSWYTLATGCTYLLDATLRKSILCFPAPPPAANTTAPSPQLSDGAVAGILVAFAVLLGVAITLGCLHVHRAKERASNPERFKKLRAGDD